MKLRSNVKSAADYVELLKRRKKLVQCASVPAMLSEDSARLVDELVKSLPSGSAYQYRRRAVIEAPEEIGERSLVATLTNDSVDLEGEIVLPDGIETEAFDRTKVVYFNHAYDSPLGLSQWLKRVDNRIKGKLVFQERPDEWPAECQWLPDFVHAMCKAGVIKGTSIGFLPLEIREPTPEEVDTLSGAGKPLSAVITRAALIEWSVTGSPANPDAEIEQVKSLDNSQPLGTPEPVQVQPVQVARKVAKKPAVPYRKIAQAISRVEIDVAGIVRDVLDAYLNRGRL